MSPVSSADSASLYSPTQKSKSFVPSSPISLGCDPYSLVLTKLYRQSSAYVCPYSKKTSSSAYYLFSFYSLRQLVNNDIFCDYNLPENSDAILYKRFSERNVIEYNLISNYLLTQQRLRFSNALFQVLNIVIIFNSLSFRFYRQHFYPWAFRRS